MSRDARVAGVLHLSLVPFGAFTFVYVPLQEPAEWLSRAGAVSHMISQAIVVFLMLTWYRILKPIDEHSARVIAVLGLLGVPISVVAEVNQLAIPPMLEAHRTTVLAAQLFWGLWLAVVAVLIFRSRFLPVAVGALVLAGSAGYLFDSFAHFLGARLPAVSQFTAVGELALPVWLLIKGLNEPWNSSSKSS
jgi:hypothetical protein